MEAAGVDVVRANLGRLRIVPTKIKKKPKDLFENVSFLQPKVTKKDVILFCRQFSTMIDAGLPIIQCMDILHAQQENATFKKMLKAIKEQVESGSTLADALKKYPKQFDDLFVNMIAAGEAGGILDTILRRLSAHMEKAAGLEKPGKRRADLSHCYNHHRHYLCCSHFDFRHPRVRGNVCRHGRRYRRRPHLSWP
jgi:type IV pilus assembly protein PilC